MTVLCDWELGQGVVEGRVPGTAPGTALSRWKKQQGRFVRLLALHSDPIFFFFFSFLFCIGV